MIARRQQAIPIDKTVGAIFLKRNVKYFVQNQLEMISLIKLSAI